MNHHILTLPNGIRAVFAPSNSPISHACIVINAGTRDELPHQFGMAHFIEHLLFKKTEKRSTNQILNRLELVGADLNAYTTKEYTCIHASFLKIHLARTLDLFEDIVFHSVFPEQELIKEKGVIYDEIASYLDSPEEAIADDFEDLLFQEHALGHNILGTEESLTGIQREDVQQFIAQNYNTDEMVIGITGDYPLQRVKRMLDQYFSVIPARRSLRHRPQTHIYQKTSKYLSKPISQSHTMMGNVAYSMFDKSKYGLMLLNNLLGGMGMSSRLNLQIREKYGIAYTVESNYTPLLDTGIFSIYFGTDADKVAKATRLVEKELQKLGTQRMGTVLLHQAKQKFLGQIALAEENRMGVIISMAKNLIDYEQINTLAFIFEKINDVSAEDVLEIANTVLLPQDMTRLTFSPENHQ